MENNNKMILVGVAEKKGEYQGMPYHNFTFHFTEPFTTEGSLGRQTGTLKVKFSNLADVFGGTSPSSSDLANALNKPIEVAYNRFGYPIAIKLNA